MRSKRPSPSQFQSRLHKTIMHALLLGISITSLITTTMAFSPPGPFSNTVVPTVSQSPFVSHVLSNGIRNGRTTNSRLFLSSSSSLFRRPLLTEADLASPPDKRVIDAVVSLGGKKVIASDVAAKAGVSLSEARKSLSSLASLTAGDIAVTDDGELLYTFSSDPKSALASNSARYRAIQTFEKVWPKLFYGIRVGFGIALFVSIFAIFSTLLFVSSGGSSDRDDDRKSDRRGGGGGFGMNLMFDLFYPRNYFYYRPYYGYYGSYNPYLSSSYFRTGDDGDVDGEEDPNLFERIFAYIFGDGNPNRGLESARLRAAARTIRKNGGAVTAEQLAPFLDVPDPESTNDDSTTLIDESYVLPIVGQLGGEPVVTDDGDIVYVFPELQISSESTLAAAGLAPDASSKDIQRVLRWNGIDSRSALERRDLIALLEKALAEADERQLQSGSSSSSSISLLEEQELEFNKNGAGWNALAGGLGALNLVGALYLGQVLSSPALVGYQLPAWYGLVQSSYPLLLIYAVLFNVLPLARFVYQKKANAEIEERNRARRNWSSLLSSASDSNSSPTSGGSGKLAKSLGKVRSLKKKLTSAASMRRSVRRLDREKTVYDTSRNDAMDLEKKREEDAMKMFDDLLKDEDGGAFQ